MFLFSHYKVANSGVPFPWNTCFQMNLLTETVAGKFASVKDGSDSFTILGLWVLGLAVPYINESQLQTYESNTLLLMTSLQYYCIPGLAGTR